MNFRKLLKRVLIVISILSVLYIAFVYILFSTMERKNYKEYCTTLIPKLESYYKLNSKYPPSLYYLGEDKKSDEKCGYRTHEDSFAFDFSDGFIGVIGYDSIRKEWWSD